MLLRRVVATLRRPVVDVVQPRPVVVMQLHRVVAMLRRPVADVVVATRVARRVVVVVTTSAAS